MMNYSEFEKTDPMPRILMMMMTLYAAIMAPIHVIRLALFLYTLTDIWNIRTTFNYSSPITNMMSYAEFEKTDPMPRILMMLMALLAAMIAPIPVIRLALFLYTLSDIWNIGATFNYNSDSLGKIDTSNH